MPTNPTPLCRHPTLRATAVLVLVSMGMLLGAGRAAVADVTLAPDAATQPPAPAPAKPTIPAAMASPRAVLKAFMERMQADEKRAAAELLDLSGLVSVVAEGRGQGLALQLYKLIPALGTIPTEGGDPTYQGGAPSIGNPEEIGFDYSSAPSTDDAGTDPWPLSAWLIEPLEQAERIVIAPDADGVWRFSAETVARIDDLYRQLIDEIDEARAQTASPIDGRLGGPTETLGSWIESLFPPSLRKSYFLIPTYQWIVLLALLPVGRLLDELVRAVLTFFGDRVLLRIDPEFGAAHETTAPIWRPIGRLANASLWVYGAHQIDLPNTVLNVLVPTLVIVAIVAAMLAVHRVFDVVAGYFLRRAKRRDRRYDDLVIPLANATAKIAAVLIAGLATLAIFNDQLPATLLGGLGIGGIAIALASQEMLSNFFGSLAILLDRPFGIGDWVCVDGLEGEVESLGFRSTRLRTGLNSQVTLPNSKLAGASIDNWGRRKYRRYLNKLGLEYGTPPDRIEAFCEGIRELVRRHPHTRKDYYAAYFNDFGPSSLDVLVVVYFEAPDWATELRERHRLLADIARLAESLGVSFAFPTQTLHLHRGETAGPTDLSDEKPDLAGARAAAEIAGELPNYQDRPGRVKFPGPTSIPPS